ncbi:MULTISPECIES: phosphonate ABC transporter ATP-binding protein [Hyphomicrobiales]|jgi:phosphonate transport system ATP-binding protein|uniref:Phosphonate transport system ATP-binding protein n=3 Tax=Hyphomicrobiales TaxID=356 RepID=A0A9W6CJX7_XANFL|nr:MULTISPECIES: phosphonate ABC transporter ATP-binding protein [Hyphomicrobiales]KZB97313.1 Phosphate-import ATP-binding protein PhnC [Methylobacterium radiotolerans]MBA4788424.1 phosphonate ABC transporter ATP-binding protein [Hyphomicrobiales bacterium]MBY0142169.1 phosphonate ABC transporter ATP-binding protein [Methylorubrum populi]MDV2986815.1 phosphonate ABC transporter ATP-binding protein [Methylobacteriaceae bacterium AG10]OYY88332.1 MAG: phosphonate ABC transporter ATP-binding prote
MKSIAPAHLPHDRSLGEEEGAAIVVRDLSKAFDGRVVLDRVSCTVPAGQFVVLLGPSGCGKSTLFRCLTRLVEPDAGSVTIRGTEVTALKPAALEALRREVGFVFQQFNLVKRFSAIDNVLAARLATTPLWRVLLRRFRARDRQLALACLDSVGLMDQAYQRAERLSGGQQQRVAIARAFAQQAELILADEPISSLDPESSENVLQILQRAARERGFSVLCSLHQVDLAVRYADRIIALRQGRLFFDGPAAAFTPGLREDLYRAARS